MAYKDLLKHPKWQKKRLEIFERDEFRCQLCWDNAKSLHVHHKYYRKGQLPWKYQLKAFLTLCEKCHSLIHPKKKSNTIVEENEIELTPIEDEARRSYNKSKIREIQEKLKN